MGEYIFGPFLYGNLTAWLGPWEQAVSVRAASSIRRFRWAVIRSISKLWVLNTFHNSPALTQRQGSSSRGFRSNIKHLVTPGSDGSFGWGIGGIQNAGDNGAGGGHCVPNKKCYRLRVSKCLLKCPYLFASMSYYTDDQWLCIAG